MPSVRNMQPSDWLLVFMAGHEGCKLNAYQIIVSSEPLKLDYPTYGFGCVTDFEEKWKKQCIWPAGQFTKQGGYYVYTGSNKKWILADMGAAMKLMRDKLSKSFVPNIRRCFALEGFPDFELTQNQFDAIVSRSWGGCAMGKRTDKLRSLVHAICHYGVYSDQTMFVMSGPCTASGKVLKGLVRRRVDEINMLRGHFDPHKAEFRKYCKYLGLDPDKYHADGVNGIPVTESDVEAITKQWYACADAFVKCRKEVPTCIERSDAALQFKTGWVGIGDLPIVSSGSMTRQDIRDLLAVAMKSVTAEDGTTQTTTTDTASSPYTGVATSKDGKKTTIQMGNPRQTPTPEGTVPVQNEEDAKERQRLIDYIVSVYDNRNASTSTD